MLSKEQEFMNSIHKQIEDFEFKNGIRINTLYWGINVDCDEIVSWGTDEAYRHVNMSWKKLNKEN